MADINVEEPVLEDIEAPAPAPKAGGKRKTPETANAEPARKSSRTPKARSQFLPETVTRETKSTEIAVGDGQGSKLSEIPNIASTLKKCKADSEEVKMLHKLLAGTPGKKQTRKRVIGQFNGFADNSDAAQTKFKAKLGKFQQKQLKTLCELLDLKTSNKEEMVSTLTDFLFNPVSSGNEPKKDKAKRPLSAYFKFSAEFRAEVKEELGDDAGVTEVAKELGRRWGQLSEKEKAKYKDGAAAPAKKAAKKAAKAQEESGSEEEEEEQDEEVEEEQEQEEEEEEEQEEEEE